MTEPNKHRHASPKRSATASSASAVLSWFRTTPGMILVAVLVLGLAFVIRLAATGDEKSPVSKAIDPKAPGAPNASYGNRWTSPEGHQYELSVATLNDLVSVGSPSACVAAPRAGTANLHFTVTIKNRSRTDAPVPTVLFGTNLGPAGTVRKSLPAFARANQTLDIAPLSRARTCADGAKIEPQGRVKIPHGGSVTFTGTFGPTKVPVAHGIVVVVRYFVADGSKSVPTDLLAPFGDFPR